MGLFSKITKAGLVMKAVDYARRPENQAKIKSAVASFRAKRGSSGSRSS